MKHVVEALKTSDTKLVLSLLDGFNLLLQSFAGIFTADGENVIMADLELHSFSVYLNKLQSHKSSLVYKRVSSIIQKHFNYE